MARDDDDEQGRFPLPVTTPASRSHDLLRSVQEPEDVAGPESVTAQEVASAGHPVKPALTATRPVGLTQVTEEREKADNPAMYSVTGRGRVRHYPDDNQDRYDDAK